MYKVLYYKDQLFRRGDTEIRLTGNGNAAVTLYSKGDEIALRFSANVMDLDVVAED